MEVAQLTVGIHGDLGPLRADLARVPSLLAQVQAGAIPIGGGAGGDAGARFSGMASGLRSFGAAATQTGTLLTTALTVPMVGVGIAAIKMSADYEQGMNILQSTSHATAAQMAAIDKLAIQLGNDMTLPGTSALDAAKAMTELNRLGLSITDTMAAARGVLQLSAAAQISNAQAATITARALNAFRLPGEEAARVADLLAGASRNSGGRISELGFALKNAGATFALAKLPIEDLATAIAIMAKNGINGAVAGSQLQRWLLAAAAPTTAGAIEMKKYGLSFYDAMGHMKPFREQIAMLREKLAGLTDQQQQHALKAIFGTFAIKAASIMLREGAEGFDKMKTAVTQHGSAAEMANARMKGFNGALEQLKNAWETLLLQARPLLPVLTNIVLKFAEWMSKLGSLNPAMRQTIVVVAALAALAGPVLLLVGSLAGAVSSLITFGGLFAGGALAGVAASLGPILLGVGAVAGAVALLAAAWAQNWGGIRERTAAFVAWITPFLQQAWNVVRTDFLAAWNVIAAFAKEIWPPIMEVMQRFAAFVKAHWSEIRFVISAAWDAIKGVVQIGWALVSGIIRIGLDVLRGDWRKAWTDLGTMLKGAWDGLVLVVGGGMSSIGVLIKVGLNGLVDILGKMFTGWWQMWADWGAQLGLKAALAAQQMMNGLVTGVRSGTVQVVAAVTALAVDVVSAIRSTLGIRSPSTVMHALGVNIGQGLANGMTSTHAQVQAAFKKMVDMDFASNVVAAQRAADARSGMALGASNPYGVGDKMAQGYYDQLRRDAQRYDSLSAGGRTIHRSDSAREMRGGHAFNITMNISAVDAQSFNLSRGQIMEDMYRQSQAISQRNG